MRTITDPTHPSRATQARQSIGAKLREHAADPDNYAGSPAQQPAQGDPKERNDGSNTDSD